MNMESGDHQQLNIKNLYWILYGSWIASDLLTFLYFVAVASDLSEVLTELILRHALGALPLPIGLIIELAIDPSAVILQAVLLLVFAVPSIFFELY